MPASPTTTRPLPISVVTDGMVTRRIDVAVRDVVFVKGIVDASEGLAAVFAETGGQLVLASTTGREAELDRLVSDLAAELGAPLGGGADA